ncbi:TIGR00341 family protein [Leeia sp. TBRC 13508]|uniref:TIGR00341 family protein n=1 Tax=Leeia speluncae TaxID=2884804 RepID=A0ABS8D4J5_9NEIS|nr:TIGR00341 family protein [Leeia speluncae]MCB6183136.1 TIGR00341 family protein [Leeia speluncae]
MNSPYPEKRSSHSVRIRRVLKERFSLSDDKAEDAEIEYRIRDGVELRGATPWILMFAIFVASIGLNVNSTAVIIGAMLISPLMGPIMGVGLGLAVYDFDLVKRSLTNLFIATIISLIVSAIYFSLTPLQQTQSELLARTSPTLWDVLIALFGGLAGIIGITRKERSNVLPGVAIATALMPPVCTAGFGLATGQWRFFGGAMYLYAINCVFISLATVVGIRALRLKKHGFANPKAEHQVKLALLTIALVTSVPSGYLALDLVRQEVFRAKAQSFINQEFVFANAQVVDSKIDPDKREIDLSLLGEPIPAETLKNIEAKLAAASLEGTKIILHQAGENRVDVTALKSSLLSDLLKESQETIKLRDSQVEKLRAELALRDRLLGQATDVTKELKLLFPEVQQVMFTEGVIVDANGDKSKTIFLKVTADNNLTTPVKTRVSDWLKARLKSDEVMIQFEKSENS